MTNLRDLMQPIPKPPPPPRWDRLTHPIRCNNRIRINARVRACSVCGDLRSVR